MSGLNGVAHVILTAGDFARSTAFWRAMIAHLELKVVLDSEHMLYGVGGRTAIGIRTGSLENAGKRFDQGAPGLHHACFRMRDRAAVDAVHGFLARRDDIRIVHEPQEEPWAPGYYSVLFEDPDGIRIEFNHVPGVGLLAEGEQIGAANAFD
ncbi:MULTISPECIES: VOC family protein [unclassified Sphingopyxis]|jgi:catechol 2,3-dioxygenase-like lactoylglutathione lyase family enzyme|uniref:VOC family protein n=1 Tax=unclassified Sphingopyxis TaxID=2614943 RepID=UPI0006BEC81B|nr:MULTISPECIES: VOC family protein [unclassified Sphingopyxis]USI76284.1 VOC family protein [Sphingopyxis sp. USTB-05]GAO77003.1 lactoylglutathione lyase [Sphingopyxis sp. C-1]